EYRAPAPSYPPPQPEQWAPAPSYPPPPPQQEQWAPTPSYPPPPPQPEQRAPAASYQPPAPAPPPAAAPTYTSGILFGQAPSEPQAPYGSGQSQFGGSPQPVSRRAVSPTLVAAGAAVGVVALLALLYLYVLPHRSEATTKGDAPTLEKPAEAGAFDG